MERGIKDEGFIRRALEVAEHEHGRWIAHQDNFNWSATEALRPSVHAALVTAVSIYVQKYGWPEEEVKNALAATTVGEARELIDRLSPLIPEQD